jgi:hypothetical protein
MIQPLARFTNDTDSAATVLYFERIIHGQRLEAFVPTTPKPLLTVIYGLLWSVTQDWRALTIASIGAGALAVALAARLAARLGGAVAGAVVVIALLAWPDFQTEVANGNSFVWGLALWLVAGVLMTGDRPRPWLAGITLALAGLARTETFWLVGAAFCCTAFVAWQTRRGGERARLLEVAPLLLGALAVPVMCLHDLILTGRPLYWLSVPTGYTALATPNLAAVSPLRSLHAEIVHYLPAAPLIILAGVGVAGLLIARRRALVFALACLICGVLFMLVYLPWRAVFVTTRYYQEADAPILLLVGIGAGFAAAWTGGRIAGRRPRLDRWKPVAGVTLAVALALGAVAVDVPKDTLGPALATQTAGYSALEQQVPTLRQVLAGATGGVTTVRGVSYPVADPDACRVFVPRHLLPLIAVETGASIGSLGDSYLAFGGDNYSALRPGQYVLHISAADGAGGAYAPFERSTSSVLAVAPGRDVRITPLYVNQGQGVWFLRIDAA